MLANAKSGLVIVFHLPEWKLSCGLGSKSNWIAVTEAQVSRANHLD